MTPRERYGLLTLAGLVLIAVGLSAFLGPVPIAAPEIFAALCGRGSENIRTIVWELRLPRALAAFVAGASLGASGAALQGLLRNPLADPGVLGVSSCAALGAVTVLYFNLTLIGAWVLPMGAVLAALAATALLYGLGATAISTTRLILVGVGLSSFAGAMISLVMNLAPTPFALSDLVSWLFGSVSNRSFPDISRVLIFMIAGLGILVYGQRALSALTLGEDTAVSLGVDLKRTRLLVIAGASLLTGASVALAGAVGFVGIIAPHLARPLVAQDPGRLILPSALLAGLILVLTDIIIRILPFAQELRLGVIAGLIGAPVFIWIAARTARLAP